MSEEIRTHKWFIVPKDRGELLSTTKELIVEIRELADEQDNLQRLRGNEELTGKLDEVLQEIHSQFDKISSTVQSSTMVFTQLRNVCENVQKIHEFFGVLKTTRMFIFRKKRLGKDMTVLYNNLRHSCTQLMASVSLELVGRENSDSPPADSRDLVRDGDGCNEIRRGHQFLYGINRSVNYTQALECYKIAATGGSPDAMAMVALCYYQGYGVDKDLDTAVEWLVKTLPHNHAHGKYILGLVYIYQLKMGHGGECLHAGDSKCDDTDGDGDGSVGEVSSGPEQGREELFQKAIRMFSESAEMGHTDAQTALGQLYELSADDETAVKWYVAASSRGCSRARNLLAMMYFEGKGVPKLKEKAYELFKQAANGGDVCAMNNVAMCLEQGIGVDKDVACALQIYKTGADSGSAQSAYSYGYLLVQHAMASIVGSKVFPSSALVVTGRVQNSAESVRREHDLQEGTRYLRIALEKGVSEAGYQIARLYEQGVGVPLDHSSAYSNFLWASRLGHVKSAFCAANMLYENCVSFRMRNSSRIESALENSAEYESVDCCQNLRFAASLYHQAAVGGIVEAMNAYGVMLEDGTVDGTPGRGYPTNAATWYHAAAEGGLLEAVGNLDILLRKHSTVVEVHAVDGRTLPRKDVLEWIKLIKLSPFVRQGDFKKSEQPTSLLSTHGNKAKSGQPDTSDVPHPTKMSVAILPKLFESPHFSSTFNSFPTDKAGVSAGKYSRMGKAIEALDDKPVSVDARVSSVRPHKFAEEKEPCESSEMDQAWFQHDSLNKVVQPSYMEEGMNKDSIGAMQRLSGTSKGHAEEKKSEHSGPTPGVSRLKTKKSEYSLG